MMRLILTLLTAAILASPAANFLGFDRNLYPGDNMLPALRKTFSYSGYWLNAPPGETATTWTGKRASLINQKFGFLVLYNGKLYADIKRSGNAAALGKANGKEACSLAAKESFPPRTIIFLDQEEGGRQLPEQLQYILAWVDEVTKNGFGAGVYCSAIPFRESDGIVITTLQDIQAHAAGRTIEMFVYQDTCPPSPGCTFSSSPLLPAKSGFPSAGTWQYAQSPRRPKMTASCRATYSANDLCLAPGLKIDIDASTSLSADPSHGR